MDRRAPYGFGIPKATAGVYNANAMSDREMQQRKCIYTNGGTNGIRYLAILPQHMDTRRVCHTRDGESKFDINIPLTQHAPTHDTKTYMAAEINNNNRTQLQINDKNEIIWNCGHCGETCDKEKGITTHIGKMRNETKIRELICPYCHATFYNVGNLKLHD